MEALLKGKNITFAYPGQEPLIREAGFAFSKGSLVLVRGPSGAGKSTFLRLLNRMESPVSGSVFFQGRALESWDPVELRTRIILLQQTPVVAPGTVRENLLLPFTFAANRHLERPAEEAMEKGLAEFLLSGVSLKDRAADLSVGQRQRLCLLRALLLSPDVFLLDEPTSALDPESRAAVERIAEHLCLDHGLLVVIVSHLDFSARRAEPKHFTLGKHVLEAVE